MATTQKPNPLLAFGAYLAAVVGVGMFGLPYIAARTGFVPFLVALLVVTPIIIIIHVRFADMVRATPERLRIAGYVHRYLGTGWGRLSAFVTIAGLTGSMVAYLIVGSGLLQILLLPAHLSSLNAVLLFFALGSALIVIGTRSIAWTDLLLMAFFFVLLIILGFAAAPHFVAVHLATLHWAHMPVAYGVILFSLWGLSLVPEAMELSGKTSTTGRGIIGLATGTASFLYLVFVFLILGVTGTATTPNALDGYTQHVSTVIRSVAACFGFIAVFTSYISLGLTLRQSVQLEFRLRKTLAIGITTLVPLALFLFGVQNFLSVIGVTGAVLLGTEGMLVLGASAVCASQRGAKHSRSVTMVLIILLALGLVYEVVHSLGG